METLKLTLHQAKKLYQTAPASLQEIFKATFGEIVATPFSYKDIKTYDDAVEARPVDDDDIIYETDSPHIVAYKKICHIVKTINNGWTPDWRNDNQHKYNPYFKVSPSGSGFSDSLYDYLYTSTDVGSRLLTDSSEKALYMANQFQDLYVQYLLITK